MDAYAYITLPFYVKQYDCVSEEQDVAWYDAPFYDADESIVSVYGRAGVGIKPGFRAVSRMAYREYGTDGIDESLRIRYQAMAKRSKRGNE